jgi:TonB family protein
MSTRRLTIGSITLCLVLGMTACALRQGGPEPLRVGGNIRPPEKTRNVDPRYPPEAQLARVTGVVIMDIVIGPGGHVTSVEVVRSVPLLDDAAVAAVTQWKYRPTLLNGVAVPIATTVTMNFQLR